MIVLVSSPLSPTPRTIHLFSLSQHNDFHFVYIIETLKPSPMMETLIETLVDIHTCISL